jgi:uncharacterized short protein YbdD (DUF466 family)
MLGKLKSIWPAIRRLSGDDAYERYLAHYAEYHAQEEGSPEQPLTREDFFKQWQDNKWKGIKRCC